MSERGYDDPRTHERRHRERHQSHEDEHRYGQAKRRDRSRSRSPDSSKDNKDRLEQERRERMAKLRAENEQEERRLVEVTEPQDPKEKRAEPKSEFVTVDDQELEGLDEEEQMKRLLGFSGGFASTKGEVVEDNASSAARGVAGKNKARKYRQYMNRVGGFNRPLDKMN